MSEKDPKNNFPPPAPQTPGSPNWGLMVLMAVIAGILLMAFVFDGVLAPPAKAMKLDEFQQDYRNGLIVLHDQKNFPIEVLTSDGSSGQSETLLRALTALPSTVTCPYLNSPNCSILPTMSVVSVAGAFGSRM